MGSRGGKPARALAISSAWLGGDGFPSQRRDEIESNSGIRLDDETWRGVDYALKPLIFAIKQGQTLPMVSKKKNANHPGASHYRTERETALRSIRKIQKSIDDAFQELEELNISDAQWSAMDRALQEKSGKRPHLRQQIRNVRNDLIKQSVTLEYLIEGVEKADNPVICRPDQHIARAWSMQRLQRALAGRIDTDAPSQIRVGGPTEFQKLVRFLGVYDLPDRDAHAYQRLAEMLSDDLLRKLQDDASC